MPDAPTGLQAAASGQTSITLEWDVPGTALTIVIERSEGSAASFTPWMETAHDTTPQEDTNLNPGTECFYRACYRDPADPTLVSEWAGPVSATTHALTAPLAPANLTAAATSSSSITVEWTDQAGDEDAYRVERSRAGAAYVVLVDDLPVDAEWYVDEGLDAETEYSYQVYATNAAGPSGAAGPASATTDPAVTLSYTISVPAASSVGTYTVTLTASAGSTPPADAFIEEATNSTFTTGYKTYTTSSFSSPWARMIVGQPNGTYYYRGGSGTNVSSHQSILVGRPTQPVTITVYPTYDNQIVLDNYTTGSQTNTVFPTSSLGVGGNYISRTRKGALYGSKIRFDLSSLAGATVSSATLSLYAATLAQDQQSTYSYQVGANRYNWSGAAITGGTTNAWVLWSSGTVTKGPPTATKSAWQSNVTTIVQNWVGGTWSNYGFLVAGVPPAGTPTSSFYRTTYFYSSEAIKLLAQWRPALTITYTPAP